jgi:hypothetical protein
MNFCPEEYDAGASSSKREWKTTQHTSMHFEVIFEFKKVISRNILKRL